MSDESWRGRVGRMDETEVTEFLAEPQFLRLACLDDQGWPYVVPCWQEWDGNSFWVIPREKSAWARHLVNDPRCAITVDEAGGVPKGAPAWTPHTVEEANTGGQLGSLAES